MSAICSTIGGGRVQQDRAFSKQFPGGHAYGVFDGHSSETGHIAAQAASDSIQCELEKPAVCKMLNTAPEQCMKELFECAHRAIWTAFEKHLTRLGYEVKVGYREGDSKSSAENAFLLKKKPHDFVWKVIKGGTTATLVIILEPDAMFNRTNTQLIVASVGDSTALLGGISVPDSQLNAVDLSSHCQDKTTDTSTPHVSEGGASASDASTSQPVQSIFDCAEATAEDACAVSMTDGCEPTVEDSFAATDVVKHEHLPGCEFGTLVLSSDEHSPENPSECARMISCCPNPKNNSEPYLEFLYDSQSWSQDKLPIFEYSSGIPNAINQEYCGGKFYKNVRKEWASYVNLPSTSGHQESLAMTRSLGDFYLDIHGVPHDPEVLVIDLDLATSTMGDRDDGVLGMLMLASDGVWDNWKFSDAMGEILNPLKIPAVIAQVATGAGAGAGASASSSASLATGAGAGPGAGAGQITQAVVQRLTDQFLAKNDQIATGHFGSSRDNQIVQIILLVKDM